MRPIYTFTLSAIGLTMLYVILTSAGRNNAALSTLLGTGFKQFNATIAQLQGRGNQVGF